MNLKIRWLATISIALISNQVLCQTIQELRIKIQEELKNPEENIEQKLQNRNDGQPAFADRLRGSLSNFEQLFQGLIDFEPEEQGMALAARWNSPQKVANGSLGLAIVAREPTVYDSLQSSIQEDSREAILTNLKDRLRDDDNLTFSASWNLESKWFGRKTYLDDKILLSRFLGVIVEIGIPSAYTFDPITEMTPNSLESRGKNPWIKPGMAKEWEDFVKSPFININEIELKYFTEDGIDHIKQGLEREILRDSEMMTQLRNTIKAYDFKGIVERLYNQPQFNITVNYKKPDKLVGPESYSLNINFEKGFENLNTLRNQLKSLANAGQDTQSQLQAFKKALNDPASSNGRRLTFSLEYERTKAYDNAFLLTEGFTEDQFTMLQTEGFDVTKANLIYGQNIALNKDGSNPYRMDLSAVYESFPDEAMQPDKFVASLTLTSLLTDKITAPISLIYSNHEMYLGEVDEQFSINFGIKWGLN